MSLDLQIVKAVPRTEEIKIVTPTLRFTPAQRADDRKLYSLKDIYDASSNVEIKPTEQPTTRG